MPSPDTQLDAYRKLIATNEPPMLGPQRRPGMKGAAELDELLAKFIAAEGISGSRHALLRSAALLWHDHLDASHTISQGIESRDGSWLHGIMHRREPDYGNAKYWFHRVGKHEAFPKLAERVAKLLSGGGDELARRLIMDGEWSSFAFVDECERAERGSNANEQKLLRDIQAIEFDTLVEHILTH